MIPSLYFCLLAHDVADELPAWATATYTASIAITMVVVLIAGLLKTRQLTIVLRH